PDSHVVAGEHSADMSHDLEPGTCRNMSRARQSHINSFHTRHTRVLPDPTPHWCPITPINQATGVATIKPQATLCCAHAVGAGSLLGGPQPLFQHHGIIEFSVPGSEDKRHATAIVQTTQALKRPGLFARCQFFLVAALKRIPFFRVVAEPLAQVGTGRKRLQPQVNPGIGLGHAARPHAVHQHPIAVVCCRHVVSALQSYITHGPQSFDPDPSVRQYGETCSTVRSRMNRRSAACSNATQPAMAIARLLLPTVVLPLPACQSTLLPNVAW